MRALLPLLATLFIAAPAHAAKGHSHGFAELEVSVDGDVLSLALESPLDNLLGFERIPQYEKDFAKVREVAAVLRAGDKLFVPTAAAACTLLGVTLSADAISPELLGEKAAPAAARTDHEHADLDASYRFKCAKPAELKNVEVQLFDSFKRIRFINAQLVAGKTQRAARLSAKSRSLAW